MALAPQFKNVSVSAIIPAKYNPKKRTQGPKIRQLARSMATVGLLYPILIDKKNKIIDGHRRFFAAKMNLWETIGCLVIDGDAEAMYAEVNANSLRPSGNDMLWIYLEEPNAVTPRTRANLSSMEDRIGRSLVELIAKHGFSTRLYRVACSVCKECGKDTDEWVKRTVRWFITCEAVGRVYNMLTSKMISPMLLLRHVKMNKPLRVKVL